MLVTLDVFWAERVNLQEKYDDPTRLITIAARCPASSLPTNIHALRPIAQGLICRSRWLLSMGTAPSARWRVSAFQWLSV